MLLERMKNMEKKNKKKPIKRIPNNDNEMDKTKKYKTLILPPIISALLYVFYILQQYIHHGLQ